MKRRDAAGAAVGAFLAMAGIVIDVFEVGGGTAQVLSLTGLTLAGLFVGVALAARLTIRLRQARLKRQTGDKPLGEALATLGHDVLTFYGRRHVASPRFNSVDSPVRHPLRSARARLSYSSTLRQYESATVELFHERFGDSLKKLALRLRSEALIADGEIDDLLRAADVLAIRALGIKLKALAALHTPDDRPDTSNASGKRMPRGEGQVTQTKGESRLR